MTGWESSSHPGYRVIRYRRGVMVTNAETQESSPIIPRKQIKKLRGTTRSVLDEYFSANPE